MAELSAPPMTEPAYSPRAISETTLRRSQAQARAGIDLLWVSSLVHMVKCHDLVIGSVCQQGEGIFYSVDTIGRTSRATSREEAIDALMYQTQPLASVPVVLANHWLHSRGPASDRHSAVLPESP